MGIRIYADGVDPTSAAAALHLPVDQIALGRNRSASVDAAGVSALEAESIATDTAATADGNVDGTLVLAPNP